MTEVRIAFDALRRHAAAVAGTAADLTTARDAANQSFLDTEAYGALCRFLPRMFDPVLGSAVAALTGAASALSESAARLRRVADSAETTDAVNAVNMSHIADRHVDVAL